MWFRKQQYPCQPVCLAPKRCRKAISLPSPQYLYLPLSVIAEGGEQVQVSILDVVANDVVGIGQFGQYLFSDFYRFQLVGSARRDAQVVLQHHVLAVADVNQVNAVDMDENVLGGTEPLVFRIEELAGVDYRRERWSACRRTNRPGSG